MSLTQRSLAELIGTFWLVLGGCGSAVLAAGIPDLGLGYWLVADLKPQNYHITSLHK
jgi:aquaporin Z